VHKHGTVKSVILSVGSNAVTRSRRQQISLDATPFYHVVSRCVRRAFLCGQDNLTGRSYEHRRQQIQDDLLRLSSIFFIDVLAFSIMSNHFHVLLHVDRDRGVSASGTTIVERWHKLFSGTEISQKFIKGESLEVHEKEALDLQIDTWRSRLYNISWFMKVLNEGIARRANKEDDCTGHFWESRFKSQALLDEQAILSCMAYIDLNPVRAAMASTPEQSDHTSIQMRIEHWKSRSEEPSEDSPVDEDNLQPDCLFPFAGNPRQPMPAGIPFDLLEYIQLVDWTGRIIREDKRGSIATDIPPIIQRLNISPAHWVHLCTHFESRFKGLVGSAHSLKTLCYEFGLRRRSNLQNSKLLFG